MQFCIEHPERQSTLACSRCLQQFCTDCTAHKKCPATDDNHELSSISDIVKALKDQMTDLRAALADKLSRFLYLEKDIAKKIEFINKEKQKLISEVDKTVKEQVDVITQEGEQVKTDICKYVQDFMQKADTLTASLITANSEAKELMQELECISKLAEASILEKFSETRKEVENLLNIDYQPIWVPSKHLVPRGEFRKVEFKLEELTARSMHYKTSARTTNDCYFSVRQLSENHLVSASQVGIEIRDNSLNLITSVPLSGCEDVVVYRDQLYVLQKLQDCTKKIKKFTQKLEFIRDVLDIPKKSNYPSQIAVCEDKITASDLQNRCVYVFSLDGKLIHTMSLAYPVGVCFTSDGCLLVTEHADKGSVKKYMQGGNYSLVWTSDALASPWGVQEDHTGRIYVSNGKRNEGAVYQLSSEGRLVKRTTCYQMRNGDCALGITVAGDIIYTACASEGIKKFQLNYLQ